MLLLEGLRKSQNLSEKEVSRFLKALQKKGATLADVDRSSAVLRPALIQYFDEVPDVKQEAVAYSDSASGNTDIHEGDGPQMKSLLQHSVFKSKYATPEQPYGPYADHYCAPLPSISQKK